jgi:hypothetical protein
LAEAADAGDGIATAAAIRHMASSLPTHCLYAYVLPLSAVAEDDDESFESFG